MTYDVYVGAAAGRPRCRIYTFKAENDAAAEIFVTERLTGEAIELWCHSRRIARFDGSGDRESVSE